MAEAIQAAVAEDWRRILAACGEPVPADFDARVKEIAAGISGDQFSKFSRTIALDEAIDRAYRKLGGDDKPRNEIRLPEFKAIAWENIRTAVESAERMDGRPVVLYLSGSPGGFTEAEKLLAKALTANGRKLIAVCSGLVASAATILVARADFVIATSDAVFLFHGMRLAGERLVRVGTPEKDFLPADATVDEICDAFLADTIGTLLPERADRLAAQLQRANSKDAYSALRIFAESTVFESVRPYMMLALGVITNTGEVANDYTGVARDFLKAFCTCLSSPEDVRLSARQGYRLGIIDTVID